MRPCVNTHTHTVTLSLSHSKHHHTLEHTHVAAGSDTQESNCMEKGAEGALILLHFSFLLVLFQGGYSNKGSVSEHCVCGMFKLSLLSVCTCLCVFICELNYLCMCVLVVLWGGGYPEKVE